MIFEKQIINMYKGMIHTRCDDTETVFYFYPECFPNLKVTERSFKASAGHTLCGWFYEYENSVPERLIVFDHGFGGGHLAYMKEIEMLCKHGYKVFAYDHTGCMRSGGSSPNGLAQSLCDLNDCIAMLKADEGIAGCDISVVGHSWGAFSTLNIAALHPEISHIVALSGFVSVEEMIKTLFKGILKGYRNAVLDLESESNPIFVKFNAVETLKKSDVKALLIYSENDQMCHRRHYDILKESLEEQKNVSFLLVPNKGHNPNYTENAVKLLEEFGKARAKLVRKKKLTKEERSQFIASFDWEAMTAQDDSIWQKIFEHLDNQI